MEVCNLRESLIASSFPGGNRGTWGSPEEGVVAFARELPLANGGRKIIVNIGSMGIVFGLERRRAHHLHVSHHECCREHGGPCQIQDPR